MSSTASWTAANSLSSGVLVGRPAAADEGLGRGGRRRDARPAWRGRPQDVASRCRSRLTRFVPDSPSPWNASNERVGLGRVVVGRHEEAVAHREPVRFEAPTLEQVHEALWLGRRRGAREGAGPVEGASSWGPWGVNPQRRSDWAGLQGESRRRPPRRWRTRHRRGPSVRDGWAYVGRTPRPSAHRSGWCLRSTGARTAPLGKGDSFPLSERSDEEESGGSWQRTTARAPL